MSDDMEEEINVVDVPTKVIMLEGGGVKKLTGKRGRPKILV